MPNPGSFVSADAVPESLVDFEVDCNFDDHVEPLAVALQVDHVVDSSSHFVVRTRDNILHLVFVSITRPRKRVAFSLAIFETLF